MAVRQTMAAIFLTRCGSACFCNVSSETRAMTACEALEIATLGGAAVLGRDDIGSLARGMAADIVAFALDDIWHAGGAVHDLWRPSSSASRRRWTLPW